MSTVLWANTLINGQVDSNEYDLYALYRHSKKLDKLTKRLGAISFISVQDFTDVQFNFSGEELPSGMESTDEVMAQNGVWIQGSDATKMLEELISYISKEKVKFGILKNEVEEVLNELNISLEVAKKAKGENGMFNFVVVM